MAKKIKFNGFVFRNLGDDDRLIFANFDSSNLKAAAYDIDSKHLYVVFKTSVEKRYIYLGVPSKVFMGLAKAVSPGSYFLKNVKGKFDFTVEENK